MRLSLLVYPCGCEAVTPHTSSELIAKQSVKCEARTHETLCGLQVFVRLREGFVIDARESIEILACPSDSFLQPLDLYFCLLFGFIGVSYMVR